jgi:hypothetical protein
MGKYSNVQDDIFSIFNSTSWKAENIKTFPNNFVAVMPGNEFIRVSVISRNVGINIESVSGILMIDIFTSAGNGPKRANLIADKLDQYLVGKSVSTLTGSTTQFMSSALDFRGIDTSDPALSKSNYSVPFNYFRKQ